MADGTYATIALVKTWLGITGSGDNAIIERTCLAAEDMIDSKIGVPMIAVAGTRYYHAVNDVRANGADLVIDYHTVLTTVVNGDGATINTSNIQRMPVNGLYKNRLHLKASSGLSWNWSSDPVAAIAITANFGMVAAAANVPEEIAQLAIEIAGWLYRVRDTSMGADILAQTRAGTILMPGNMPPHIVTRLNRLGGIFN